MFGLEDELQDEIEALKLENGRLSIEVRNLNRIIEALQQEREELKTEIEDLKEQNYYNSLGDDL